MLHIQKPVPSISFPFSVLSAKYPWNSKKKTSICSDVSRLPPYKKGWKKNVQSANRRDFRSFKHRGGKAVVLCDTLWRRECGPILLIMKIWHTILILMNVVMMMMMRRRRRRIRLYNQDENGDDIIDDGYIPWMNLRSFTLSISILYSSKKKHPKSQNIKVKVEDFDKFLNGYWSHPHGGDPPGVAGEKNRHQLLLKGGSYISKISDTLLSSPNFRQLVPGNFLTLTRGGGAPGPISHDRNRAKTKPLGGFIAESLRFWRRFSDATNRTPEKIDEKKHLREKGQMIQSDLFIQ